MRNLLRIGLLAGALAVLGWLLVYLWGAPRILEVLPADGAEGVPAGAQVEIAFSQPLDSQAVQERLSFDPPVDGSYVWEGSRLVFTPQQPWPAGATIRVRLQAGAPASSFPALGLREEREWSFTIRWPQIIYLFPVDGPANLFRYDPVSSESQALTDLAEGVLDYAVSGDGKTVYFSVRRETEGSAIYRLDLASGQNRAGGTQPGSESSIEEGAQVVFECLQAVCSELALERSGRYLAYERSALPGGDGAQMTQVWILPLQPAGENRPFLAREEDHQTLLPAWSNEGLLAVYDSQESAYLFIEPEAGIKDRFPNQTGQQGAWRPDARAFLAPEIIYLGANISPELSNLESLADSHLILYTLGSGEMQDLTPGEGVEDAAPAYSPDGSFLAFARKYLDIQRWTPGRQLWIAQAQSREARQISDEAVYNHFDFAWSPAGDQLVFMRFNQSALSEPPEIWLLDLTTNQASRLMQGGYKPGWIP